MFIHHMRLPIVACLVLAGLVGCGGPVRSRPTTLAPLAPPTEPPADDAPDLLVETPSEWHVTAKSRHGYVTEVRLHRQYADAIVRLTPVGENPLFSLDSYVSSRTQALRDRGIDVEQPRKLEAGSVQIAYWSQSISGSVTDGSFAVRVSRQNPEYLITVEANWPAYTIHSEKLKNDVLSIVRHSEAQ